jgi:hypothetical protein
MSSRGFDPRALKVGRKYFDQRMLVLRLNDSSKRSTWYMAGSSPPPTTAGAAAPR